MLLASALLSSLEQQEKKLALEWLADNQAFGYMLAILYYGDFVARTDRDKKTCFAIRDCFRHYLTSLPYQLTASDLEVAWLFLGELLPYDPPRPQMIIDAMDALIESEDRKTFQIYIGALWDISQHIIRFKRQTVVRPSIQKEVEVDCFNIDGPGFLATRDDAETLLAEWLRVEFLPLYRIENPTIGSGAFYDREHEAGLFWITKEGKKQTEEI